MGLYTNFTWLYENKHSGHGMKIIFHFQGKPRTGYFLAQAILCPWQNDLLLEGNNACLNEST